MTRYNSVDTASGSFAKNTGELDDMLMPINLTTDEQADLVAFLGTLASNLPTLTAPTYETPLPKPSQPPSTKASGN